MNALEQILEKSESERSAIEALIIEKFQAESETESDDLAHKAADERAAMQAVIKAAREAERLLARVYNINSPAEVLASRNIIREALYRYDKANK